MRAKQWVCDEDGEITGFTLFEGRPPEARAYIHDNGGGGSWIVNADGWFVGWAKDETEARKIAEDRIAEVNAGRAARKQKHPRGPRGPHSYGRA